MTSKRVKVQPSSLVCRVNDVSDGLAPIIVATLANLAPSLNATHCELLASVSARL